MRLRLVPVEYKACPGCGLRYEGATCPRERCRQPFDPCRARREAEDRLVLVGTPCPEYEPRKRCRCAECDTLVDLGEELPRLLVCRNCNEALLDRGLLVRFIRQGEKFPRVARRLADLLLQMGACRCGSAIPTPCWCPLCRATGRPDALSQREVVVWVRTFSRRDESSGVLEDGGGAGAEEEEPSTSCQAGFDDD